MRRVKRWRPTYSKLDCLMASPVHPLEPAMRLRYLTHLHNALEAMETAARPTPDDWRWIASAVDITQALLRAGHIADTDGLLHDAEVALTLAGARAQQEGKPIRLNGEGITALRGLLADFGSMMDALPARTFIAAHRAAEQRLHRA